MRGRLGTVLRIRRLAEQQAGAQVARAAKDRRTAEQRLADQRAALANLPSGPPTLSPLELQALHHQGLAAHDLVVDAVERHDVSIEREQELMRAWTFARANRKSVERLDERRRADAAAQASTAAAAALDELVLLRRHAR